MKNYCCSQTTIWEDLDKDSDKDLDEHLDKDLDDDLIDIVRVLPTSRCEDKYPTEKPSEIPTTVS